MHILSKLQTIETIPSSEGTFHSSPAQAEFEDLFTDTFTPSETAEPKTLETRISTTHINTLNIDDIDISFETGTLPPPKAIMKDELINDNWGAPEPLTELSPRQIITKGGPINIESADINTASVNNNEALDNPPIRAHNIDNSINGGNAIHSQLSELAITPEMSKAHEVNQATESHKTSQPLPIAQSVTQNAQPSEAKLLDNKIIHNPQASTHDFEIVEKGKVPTESMPAPQAKATQTQIIHPLELTLERAFEGTAKVTSDAQIDIKTTTSQSVETDLKIETAIEAETIEAIGKDKDQKANLLLDKTGLHGEKPAAATILTIPTPETSLATVMQTSSTVTSAKPIISLPTTHPAIQTVAQGLVQMQETQKGISLRLNPPEMGRVFIDFQFEADRSVTAVIRTEIAETALQLKDKVDFLQQSLKESGFQSVNLSFADNNQNRENPFLSAKDDPKNLTLYNDETTNVADHQIPLQAHTVHRITDDAQIDMKL